MDAGARNPESRKNTALLSAAKGALPRRGESYDLRGPASRTIQSRVRLQLRWNREEKSRCECGRLGSLPCAGKKMQPPKAARKKISLLPVSFPKKEARNRTSSPAPAPWGGNLL